MALQESLLLGFGIGLSGALAPGPTLLATISGAVRHGPLVGGRVAAGHLLVEIALAAALVLGIAPFIMTNRSAIAVIGGIALLGFGLLTVRSSRTATLEAPTERERTGPFLAGVLTSVANPYFWLWWATLGGALLAAAMATGPGEGISFLIGHGAADLGWLLLVGVCISRGRSFLPDRAYRAILGACGVGLVLLGLYYLTTAI
jgi:threonine/homoserine/homoserine lactone efflux protein